MGEPQEGEIFKRGLEKTEANVRKEIGKNMTGGNLIIYCEEVEEGRFSFSPKNKGEIWRMSGNKLERVWTKLYNFFSPLSEVSFGT